MTYQELIQLTTRESSYVANALKHIWLAELLQILWHRCPAKKVQIFHSEVDDAGFDIVLTWNKITRHVQLKAAHIKSKRQSVDVHTELAAALGGCVVWMFYDPVSLKIKLYRFFGSEPSKPLPDLANFPIATRVTPNSEGVRPQRLRVRTIPKGKFEVVETIEQLTIKLFGEAI